MGATRRVSVVKEVVLAMLVLLETLAIVGVQAQEHGGGPAPSYGAPAPVYGAPAPCYPSTVTVVDTVTEVNTETETELSTVIEEVTQTQTETLTETETETNTESVFETRVEVFTETEQVSESIHVVVVATLSYNKGVIIVIKELSLLYSGV